MAEQGKFKRRLSLLDLTLLGLGSIIGSGWLFASNRAAVLAGSDAWMAWVFGAVAVLLIGLVYAEMAAAIPRAGGFVRYPDYTHGSLVGFMIGFASMLAYSSVAGIEVEAVRGYALKWWPGLATPDGGPSGAGLTFQFALLILFFLINYWSVNVFGKINSVVTTLKFIVPAFTVIVLLTQLKVSNFSVGGANPGGLHGVFAAVSTAGIVFAFLGFRQAVDFGAEAKNPQKDIPRAIIFAVVLAVIVYLLLQFSFLGAVPSALLAHGWGAVQFKTPFADLAVALGFGWLMNIIMLDALISPSGTGNIYLSGTARTLFAWSKNGYFYSWFGKIDSRTGVPRGALWLTFILAALWTMPLKFQVWNGLVGAVTSATVMTYMVGPVSVASLRKTDPNMSRPFRLKGLSILSPLAYVAATLIIYWSGWSTDSLLIGLTLASLILYVAFMDRTPETRTRLRTEWKNGIWLVGYFVFIFIMSRLGSFTDTTAYKVAIPQPWDDIIIVVGALGFYYWGVGSALRNSRIEKDDTYDDSELDVVVSGGK